jgi:hypothetical protein
MESKTIIFITVVAVIGGLINKLKKWHHCHFAGRSFIQRNGGGGDDRNIQYGGGGGGRPYNRGWVPRGKRHH